MPFRGKTRPTVQRKTTRIRPPTRRGRTGGTRISPGEANLGYNKYAASQLSTHAIIRFPGERRWAMSESVLAEFYRGQAETLQKALDKLETQIREVRESEG